MKKTFGGISRANSSTGFGFFGCTGSAWVMGFREKCDTLESGEGNRIERGVMDWWECWRYFLMFRLLIQACWSFWLHLSYRNSLNRWEYCNKRKIEVFSFQSPTLKYFFNAKSLKEKDQNPRTQTIEAPLYYP